MADFQLVSQPFLMVHLNIFNFMLLHKVGQQCFRTVEFYVFYTLLVGRWAGCRKFLLTMDLIFFVVCPNAGGLESVVTIIHCLLCNFIYLSAH